MCLLDSQWKLRLAGLEYDLDLFNIVAVDDFNMGAMENKSLNIFNSRLARPCPGHLVPPAWAVILHRRVGFGIGVKEP